MRIRAETPQDVASIRDLTTRAFAGVAFSDGTEGCVVVGDPGHHGRFGFSNDPDLSCGATVGRQVRGLAFGALRPTGEIGFSPAFG